MRILEVMNGFVDQVGPASTTPVIVREDHGESDSLFCLVNSDQLDFVSDNQFDEGLKRIQSIIDTAKDNNIVKLNMLILMRKILHAARYPEEFKNNIRLDFQNNNRVKIKSMNGKEVSVIRVNRGYDFDKDKQLTTTEFKLISVDDVIAYQLLTKTEDFQRLLLKEESLLSNEIEELKKSRKLLVGFVELFELIDSKDHPVF